MLLQLAAPEEGNHKGCPYGSPVPMRLGVMQPQEVDAVVVAVRRAHDGVHVELGRLRVGEKNTGVMVELDEDDRALDAIVERALLGEAADPAEMRVGEMA